MIENIRKSLTVTLICILFLIYQADFLVWASEVSGNSVSGNGISDNTVPVSAISENTISGNAISDNDVHEKEISVNLEAQNALHELVEDQPVYALVYLCDRYQLLDGPVPQEMTGVSLQSGHQVQIVDYTRTETAFYYKVKTLVNETEAVGYADREYLAYADERLRAWEDQYFGKEMLESAGVQTDYSDVEQFPASYQGNLYELKATHPNWIFVRMDTDAEWNQAVKYELNADEDRSRSLVPASYPDSWKYAPYGSGKSWYYASTDALKYCMDPRNFLKEKTIFQFEQLTFNVSYHTQAGVQTFLDTTFMKGDIPGEGMSYANAFWKIGDALNVSPYHLASRVYQEQGKGTSPLISGTYAGYENLYNYFNVGASGSTDADVIRTGLTYARDKGWNTRYKSLYGGTEILAKNYISQGQDTLYLQKFDVDNSSKGMYWHQYMQNILAPSSEAQSILKLYKNAGSLENTFVFRIPVYENMPKLPCQVGGTETLQLEQNSYELKKGESTELHVRLNDNAITAEMMGFQSSDETVAVVNPSGIVSAVGAGQAIITVKLDDLSVSCLVNVISPLEKIVLTDENGEEKSELSLNKNDNATLYVKYVPEDTTDARNVTWSCSDGQVLDMTKAEGQIQIAAVKSGQAKITAKVGGKTAECMVAVSVPMTGVAFDIEAAELYVGQSRKVNVLLLPEDTTEQPEIVWESSNSDVLSVEEGLLRGIAEGTAVITASAGNFQTQMETEVRFCEVSFYENGQLIETKEVAYNQPVGELPDGNRGENSLFGGWFTEEGGSGLALAENYKVKGDLTVYGYWMDLGTEMFAEPVSDRYYSGKAIKPEPAVYDTCGKILVRNQDYTLSWKNNIKVSDITNAETAPSVTITGKGNYSGKKTIYFRILPKDLEDGDVTAAAMVYAQKGKVQKPKPVLYYGTKKMEEKKDYTVTYPDTAQGAYLNPGEWSVVVKGKGNFEGEREISLRITETTPVAKLKVAKIPAQTYEEGTQGVCPELKVTDPATGEILEAGKDYQVDYFNNTLPGTATVLITGGSSGRYAGSQKKEFTIKGISLSNAEVTGIRTNVVWFGEAVEQPDAVLKVTVNGEERILNPADYEVTYQKNDKAGTAAVTFTGKGGYTGKIKKNYTIIAADWSVQAPDVQFAAADTEFVYEKGGVKPEVTVRMNGRMLEKNKDYTVSYSKNTSANPKASVKVKGKGGYKGNVVLYYSIVPGDLEQLTVTATDMAASTQKGKWKSVPTVTDRNGKKLTAGTDYIIRYTYTEAITVKNGKKEILRNCGETVQNTDIVPVGTVIRVNIEQNVKAKNLNYTGVNAECTYRITETALKNVSVKVVSDLFYTGEAILLTREDLLVTYNGEELQMDEDYEILQNTYSNHIKKGNASVTLSGKGRFAGTRKVTFKIKAKPFTF